MRLLSELQAEWSLIESWIRSRAAKDRPIQILEAGCGRFWPLKMGDIRYELTGIDMDEAALEARKRDYHDLHHVIVGDLRTADLPSERYDVIYCSYVLEHVHGAEQVLERFVKWLRPGGVIVVRVPDRSSIQGFTTRLTPFWFHVMFYRYFHGLREAGQPGFAPYPTVYDKIIGSPGMHDFARRHGLVIQDEIQHGEFRRGNSLMKAFIGAYAKVVEGLSFGRVHAKAANLTFIVEKPRVAGGHPQRSAVAGDTPAMASTG
jgi:SAM-dependent methyltransferase